MHNQIMESIEQGWNEGRRVHIIFTVQKDGEWIDGINFPVGYEFDGPAGDKVVSINIGLNACKAFYYHEESGDFVYDVGVNGKPFMGNIPVKCVCVVVDPDDQSVLWSLKRAPKQPTNISYSYSFDLKQSRDIGEQEPQPNRNGRIYPKGAIRNEFAKLKHVEEGIKPGELSIVACGEGRSKVESETYKPWTPRIV